MQNLQNLRKELMEKARNQAIEQFSGKDIAIVRSVSSIEVLDESFNLFYETVKEWYSLHFPELEEYVNEPEKYLSLIISLGNRENFSKEKVLEIFNNSAKVQIIEDSSKNSSGGTFSDLDIKKIQEFANLSLEIKKERKILSEFLEEKMQKEFPAISTVAGELLGAKMIAKSSSLKKLAFFPSSTIQLLGAEKALFRHLKTNARPPKHGYLYQHPLVKKARNDKGKIARFLSGKISIAAKADYFSENSKEIAEKLKKDIEKKYY